MKLLGADGGDLLRHYLKSPGSTTLHPLLTGWLEKLEPYRVDLQGFQGYWGELDEAEMLTFLRNYDAIVCPVFTQPALAHGASILEDNFRSYSHTMAFQPYRLGRRHLGESSSGLLLGAGYGQILEGGCGFGSGCLA